MKILEQFLLTIRSYQMIDRGDCVVVAVSGGADSVALLELLGAIQAEYQLELIVAHLNHQLRGEESDADEAFIRNLARQKSLSCIVDRIPPSLLQARPQGNLEARLRGFRHQFLKRCARENRAQKIALGHTLNDQAETFLMRLIRGGGTLGLSSIPPTRKDGVIHPLLSIRRDEILGFLQEGGIGWREDKSNLDLHFFRNQVRHLLIPSLQSYNPNILERLSRSADILREDQASLMQLTEDFCTQWVSREGSKNVVEASRVASLPRGLQRNLFRRLLQAGVSGTAGTKMLTAWDYDSLAPLLEKGKSGKHLELGGVRVEREFEKLVFSPLAHQIADFKFDLALPVPGEVELARLGVGFRTRTQPATRLPNFINQWELFLTNEEMAVGLRIRNWEAGDSYFPRGSFSPKKLKELFARKKIPKGKRSSWPVVTLMGKIVFAKDLMVAAEMLDRRETDSCHRVIVEEFSLQS
ncbi:MAG: tRNA lysidine(34) synthetase TilS [Terriglobia bacterium]